MIKHLIKKRTTVHTGLSILDFKGLSISKNYSYVCSYVSNILKICRLFSHTYFSIYSVIEHIAMVIIKL